MNLTEKQDDSFDQWWAENWAEVRAEIADRTFGEEVWKAATTRMRDRCVEKVKRMADEWLASARDVFVLERSDAERASSFYESGRAARSIAKELESLTP